MRFSRWTVLTVILLSFSIKATSGSLSSASDSSSLPVENLFSVDYAKTIGDDMRHVFTAPIRWKEPQWERASVYASAVVGAFAVSDLEMRSFTQRNRSKTLDDIMKQIEPFGRQYPFAVSGSFYISGVLFKKPNARATGLDGFAASLLASEMITPALKVIIGRKRPFKNAGVAAFAPFSGNVSFPSGHSTRAFAVASVIDSHYRQKWIKITAYTVAALVAYSRMNSDVHWSSDVLAGGIIGITVGKAVVKFNQGRRQTR